jgi:ketosteroid isomerase-like protein
MSEQDIELYREGIAAWSRADRDWVLARITEDFEFHAAQLFPGIREVYQGRQGLKDFWREFIEDPWSELEIGIERIEPLDDDRLIAELLFRGIGAGSGAEVTVRYVHLAEFREGQIARIDGFREWGDAVAAARSRPAGER